VGLASGSDWTVSLAWPDLPIGAHTFVAVVDPDQAIPESNEGNNRLVDIALVARQRLFFVLMAPRGRLD
jgi:subtilase family serine protease